MQYGSWKLAFNDNDFFSWIIVATYLVACFLCIKCAYRKADYEISAEPDSEKDRNTAKDKRTKRIWLALAAFMLFLGINKQLDLQSLLTEIGRQIAREQGWYKERRELQKQMVGAALIFGTLILATLGYYSRKFMRKFWPVCLGFSFLVTFIAIRMASFHHVDGFLGQKISGIKLHLLLEFGGICFIILGCAKEVIFKKNQDPSPRDIPDL